MPDRANAQADRQFMVARIAAFAVAVAAGAIVYLGLTGSLHPHLAAATLLGVYVLILLGCGIFAQSITRDRRGPCPSVADAAPRPRGTHAAGG